MESTSIPDLKSPRRRRWFVWPLLFVAAVGCVCVGYAAQLPSNRIRVERLEALRRSPGRHGKGGGRGDGSCRGWSPPSRGERGHAGSSAGGDRTEVRVQDGWPPVPLTSLIAVAELKESGNEATLDLEGGAEIRLKKEGKVWKVVAWPLFFRELLIAGEAMGAAYEEVAGDIERGKYKKAHEAYTALGQAIRSG